MTYVGSILAEVVKYGDAFHLAKAASIYTGNAWSPTEIRHISH